jgi:GNAT superfamily N-acetyltransferase
MADGVLNPRERMAMPVIEAILQELVPKANTRGEVLAFSVPAASEGKESELTYHEATLRAHLEGMGYKAVAINEGLAVIFSELEDENFTGIGISCGGGMCNVALAYLSIPSIMFSIPKGGDFIDRSVGAVVNEHATRVKVTKEEGLDLSRAPRDKFEKALRIYYEDLVETLVLALKQSISRAESLPRSDRPLPIVLAGGTAKPKGFKDLFERALKDTSLPIEISGVRLAKVAPRILAGLPRHRMYFGCARQGRLASSGLSIADGQFASVQCMATVQGAQRQGAARAILAAIEAWATSQGCATLYLQTGADNAAAISLYESCGFELAGRYHTRVLTR